MNKLLLIGTASATAATALSDGYGCSSKAHADDTEFKVYSKMQEVEASSKDVTAKTCFDETAKATPATDAPGKVACVEMIADSAKEGQNICQYTFEVAATADSKWDPIACEKGSSAGLITFAATGAGGTWSAATAVTCDDAAAEDSAATMSAGFATLAVALFMNM